MAVSFRNPETAKPDRTVFALKLQDDRFITKFDDSDLCDNEQFTTCLTSFQTALATAEEKKYDKNVILQLIESNAKLVSIKSERKIKELENCIDPLRHDLSVYQYMLGVPNRENNEGPESVPETSMYLHVYVYLLYDV